MINFVKLNYNQIDCSQSIKNEYLFQFNENIIIKVSYYYILLIKTFSQQSWLIFTIKNEKKLKKKIKNNNK